MRGVGRNNDEGSLEQRRPVLSSSSRSSANASHVVMLSCEFIFPRPVHDLRKTTAFECSASTDWRIFFEPTCSEYAASPTLFLSERAASAIPVWEEGA